MSKPRFVVAAHSAQLQLSTGAVERAGGVVLGALDDGDRLVLSVPPPMPDAVIAAVVAPRPRALPCGRGWGMDVDQLDDNPRTYVPHPDEA